MKSGTFIGINKERRLVVGPNVKPKPIDEFMSDTGIKKEKDVIGPFEITLVETKAFPTPDDAVDELRLHEESVEAARREKAVLVAKLGGKPEEVQAAVQAQ